MVRISYLLRHVANLCAPGLIVLTLFFGFVRFHDYPVWRPEVLLGAAAIIGLGVPFGLLLSVRAKTFGAAVITVFLLAWSCEQLIALIPEPLSIWDSVKGRITELGGTVGLYIVTAVVSMAVAAILLALTGRLDHNLGVVTATVFGVMVLSTLVLPAKTLFLGEFYRRGTVVQTDLPPIIHLVLDEHIGIEGLPKEIAGGDALRDELRAFYESFGFRIFGRAYSQYSSTKISLRTMLNGRPNRYVLNRKDAQAPEIDLRHNLWFRQLAERGYRVRVYQSSDVNFCGGDESDIESCYYYPVNSIWSLRKTDLSVSTAAKAIISSFLDSLVVYRMWTGRSRNVVRRGFILPMWLRTEHKYAAPGSLPVFRQILGDLRREPQGSAFFAHLLIPHHTYLYDESCRIKRDIETWVNNVNPAPNAPLGIINSPETRRRFYASYFQQVRCVRKALQEFFEEVQQIGVYDDATIIVHGDHGSRITLAVPNRMYADLLTDADLVDNYSTLFAVYGRGFDHGFDTSFRSVQALFAELFLQRNLTQEPTDVVLNSSLHIGHSDDNEPWMRAPMPFFGASSAAPPECDSVSDCKTLVGPTAQ